PWNGSQRGLMEHNVDAVTGFAADLCVADVSLEKAEALTCFGSDLFPDLVDVVPVTGREVVETDHVLTEEQQLLSEVASDEPRTSRHQPGQRLLAELRLHFLVGVHPHR